MINDEGYLIHIDFGFILGISPGGNLGFENAAFKFNHEMIQLIDPSLNKSSAFYKQFVELCVRGYLAVSGGGVCGGEWEGVVVCRAHTMVGGGMM